MKYLRNTWYVAAWTAELGERQILSRRLLDEPVILLRETSGAVRALADRCPHRQAPLRLGTFDGEVVQCGYHGLAFSGLGECVRNPHGAVPRAARVKSYPLADRHGMLWIWMGDPAAADTASIPDFSFQDPAEFYTGQRYLHVRSNYVLEIENILDLSHIAYLHPTTLGGGGVSKGEFECLQEGDVVWSKRATFEDHVPDSLADAMGVPRDALVDRWMDVRWNAPANMMLFGGGVLAGKPRSEGRGVRQAHCFTPETATTTHYWFGICFPRSMGELGAQLAEEQAERLKVPFETEDLPMLEAQQANISSGGGRRSFLLYGDAAGVRTLRVLDRLIETETSAERAATAS